MSSLQTLQILITGCHRGLGLEFVTQYLTQGHSVTALTRHKEAPALLDLHKKYSTQLKIDSCDLENPQDFSLLLKRLGSGLALDLLINNAGVFLDDGRPLEELPDEAILKSFEINALGPLRMTCTLLPFLLKSKTKPAPKVIHISSLMGSIADNGSGGYYAYRMSKAALNMFSKSLSHDYPQLISTVLHPGWVRTEMGGAQAPTSPQDSVKGMIQVIQSLSLKESGEFFDFKGDRLPW